MIFILNMLIFNHNNQDLNINNLINLNDIKGRSAVSILEDYEGINPYIKKLKQEYLKNKKISLTENQTTYINQNHDKEPIYLNRVVRISSYLGDELKTQHELTFTPEKILIEFMLAETDKTYHVYGKLSTKQQSKMYFLPKTQVHDDPFFEPITVNVDFTPYNEILAKQGKKLYQHQEEGIKFLLSRNGSILADDMGLGKVLANDTPVLTPNGWVKNGFLKVGDYVIGSNGKSTKILGVYPQPEKNFYNITLTDGTIIESCDEHLWAVQTTNHKKRNNGFIIKELKEIMNDLTYGTKNNIKWYLPMVKPVEFEKNNLEIDPYVIGCLLGDGSFSSHNIRFTSNDYEIVEEINNRLPLNHLLKYVEPQSYHLCGDNKNGNYVIKSIRKYNLLGLKSEDKFIPNDYLYNSIDNRINLLQGLLDTDGYCAKDGTIQFYSVSRLLANGVKELVQSLGGVCRESSKIGKYKLPNGEYKICKKCFILTINLPLDITPFKLKRKLERLKTNKKYNPCRGIKSVEFSRKTTGQCIMVEADDHLYVMDQYVVTHNTTQSIIAALESGAKKILVVCPSSTKINWEREINVFCDETAIVDGKKWKEAKFTIINFDILKNFHTLKTKKDPDAILNRDLANGNFDLAIIDEAHYLKNNDSIRGKIMVELATKHNINKVWLLTGTPVANRPMDFFNLLKIIKSPIAENWKHYAVRYCEGKQFFRTLKNGQKKQIWLTDGASNLEELASKTKNIILRRLKTEVLDMPDKVITPMYQELDKKGWKEYTELWDEYVTKRILEDKKTNEDQKSLVELILLRKFIALQAIPYTIEMAENAIEMGRKVIIFTSFTEELENLQNHFGKLAVKHNGPMTTLQKQKSVDAFQQNAKVKVFIGNIKSAGVGITLTEGTVVIFNSFDWVPGSNEQAEDRAFRIGQKNDVNVYYQLFDNTISTRMWEMLNNKKDVISTIMGEKTLTEDEITTLLVEQLMN